MLDTIIEAIESRQHLAFTYRGIPRVVQPAAVGSSRAGNDSLRCYQTEGGHNTAGHVWDFCNLSEISGLSVTGNTFSNDPPGYKRGDKGMIKIYAEL